MADTKLQDLSATTTLVGTDIFYVVVDPGGTPLDRKVTLADALRNIPNGTVTAPSIAFAGDQNTGIYWPEADNFAIAVGGADSIICGPSNTAFYIACTFSSDVSHNGHTTIADEKNFILSGTTGTKFGTAVTQKLGFWDTAPVVQPADAAQAALTDSTGGSADGTLSAVSGTGDDTNINNNFTEIVTLLHAIRTALVNVGLIKGAA